MKKLILLLFIFISLFANAQFWSENFETATITRTVDSQYWGEWDEIDDNGPYWNNIWWRLYGNEYCFIINGNSSMGVGYRDTSNWFHLENPQFKVNNVFDTQVIAYHMIKLDATNHTHLTLSFDWYGGGEIIYDYAQICYSLSTTMPNSLSDFTILSTTYSDAATYTNIWPRPISSAYVDLSVLDGKKFWIGIKWTNNGVYGPGIGFTIDDMVITSWVLPIELLSQSIKNVNGSARLTWITASETNNDYFIIEKSYDALSFHEIGRLDGAGNSSQLKSYNFTDNNFKELSYYRITQVDYDGTSKSENIMILDFDIKNNIDIYYSEDNIKILLNNNQQTNIQLITINGSVIDNKISYSENIYEINRKTLPRGVYLFRIKTGNSTKTLKIIN